MRDDFVTSPLCNPKDWIQIPLRGLFCGILWTFRFVGPHPGTTQVRFRPFRSFLPSFFPWSLYCSTRTPLVALAWPLWWNFTPLLTRSSTERYWKSKKERPIIKINLLTTWVPVCKYNCQISQWTKVFFTLFSYWIHHAHCKPSCRFWILGNIFSTAFCTLNPQ